MFVMGNFHPLTMASYAMFGHNPTVLHVTNVLLHAATAVLVLLLLQELTGSAFGAFAGALLWAIHPLRVESVVWIAERKDVLFGLFYVAALVAYVRKRLLLTLVLFVLALLSKGMAVSLPLAMLAIDFLERRKAFLEKVPFFALSSLFGVIGYVGQRIPGIAPEPLDVAFSLSQRAALSCYVLLFYLVKIILPIRLSAFYPYPKFIALVMMRAGRNVAFAFLFFLMTIGVTLPIFLVGRNIAADRFTYIPSIGFAYLIATVAKPKHWPIIAIVAALLGAGAFMRSRVWHDSITLWSSVIESNPEIALPYNARAAALFSAGDRRGALRDLDRAIAIKPCYAMALRNRILLSQRLGDSAAAQRDVEQLRRCSR
jgi:protein O-mannosyl-transferase